MCKENQNYEIPYVMYGKSGISHIILIEKRRDCLDAIVYLKRHSDALYITKVVTPKRVWVIADRRKW